MAAAVLAAGLPQKTPVIANETLYLPDEQPVLNIFAGTWPVGGGVDREAEGMG